MKPEGSLSCLQTGTDLCLELSELLIDTIILPATLKNWGSSVSIMSNYRLDDRALIPSRGKGFSL
jgi:hypothetical protein